MKAKNEHDFERIQQAILQIAQYNDMPIQDSFFQIIEDIWKQDTTARIQKVAQIKEDIINNKKVAIEKVFLNRNDLMKEVNSIIQKKIKTLAT